MLIESKQKLEGKCVLTDFMCLLFILSQGVESLLRIVKVFKQMSYFQKSFSLFLEHSFLRLSNVMIKNLSVYVCSMTNVLISKKKMSSGVFQGFVYFCAETLK